MTGQSSLESELPVDAKRLFADHSHMFEDAMIEALHGYFKEGGARKNYVTFTLTATDSENIGCSVFGFHLDNYVSEPASAR